MAKVTKNSRGYEFTELSLVGMRLVNEFRRHHPNYVSQLLNPDIDIYVWAQLRRIFYWKNLPPTLPPETQDQNQHPHRSKRGHGSRNYSRLLRPPGGSRIAPAVDSNTTVPSSNGPRLEVQIPIRIASTNSKIDRLSGEPHARPRAVGLKPTLNFKLVEVRTFMISSARQRRDSTPPNSKRSTGVVTNYCLAVCSRKVAFETITFLSSSAKMVCVAMIAVRMPLCPAISTRLPTSRNLRT